MKNIDPIPAKDIDMQNEIIRKYFYRVELLMGNKHRLKFLDRNRNFYRIFSHPTANI